MIRSAKRALLFCLFFGLFFFCFLRPVSAETTSYRSASNISTDGNPGYTNLSNCSATDGLTCDRASGLSFANLYFKNFGDFGIPNEATITHVRVRVTGKANVPSLGIYTGVSRIGSPMLYYENCQFPSDTWTMYALNSSTIKEYNVTTPVTNGILVTCFSLSNIRSNNYVFRVNRAGPSEWSANIDNFEIAFDYNVAPTPTPSPSPSPSPTPTPPAPFLDLPWDYEGKGLSFTDAALSINSFFDHEFPLLSTGLGEQPVASSSVVTYIGGGRDFDSDYSSHDGYDYGSGAQANFEDPVLAAASGIATFVNSCSPCGNAIHIDHKNGYQTRYYHLQSEGLVTNIPNRVIQVNIGDPIGKVGASGNVRPKGEDGAHIHFMVVQDKNSDGNFEDNIPDGLVDPFGWQSEALDPWENYSFFYNGQNRTGNKSYYLWKEKIDGLNTNLTSNGGFFVSGRNSVNFPEGVTNENLILKIISTPLQRISDLLRSIGPSVEISTEDAMGNEITNFNKPFSLTMDFSDLDLSKIIVGTLSIYSTSDGIDWVKEDTVVDLENKKAAAQVNHLTLFALMGERRDILPATTSAIIVGEEGDDGWFRSDVEISLAVEDNEGGLGTDYILFRKDDGDWEGYETPIKFTEEREHVLEFYSVDKDENIEEKKSVLFSIDKTPAEAEIKFNPFILKLEVIGIDSSGSANVVISEINDSRILKITDLAGNETKIFGKDYEEEKNISEVSLDTLQYNTDPVINLNSSRIWAKYSYDNKAKNLKTFEQKYEVKGELKLKLVYSSKTGKTKVIMKVKGKEKVIQELAGIRILKLNTERGTLKYSY